MAPNPRPKRTDPTKIAIAAITAIPHRSAMPPNPVPPAHRLILQNRRRLPIRCRPNRHRIATAPTSTVTVTLDQRPDPRPHPRPHPLRRRSKPPNRPIPISLRSQRQKHDHRHITNQRIPIRLNLDITANHRDPLRRYHQITITAPEGPGYHRPLRTTRDLFVIIRVIAEGAVTIPLAVIATTAIQSGMEMEIQCQPIMEEVLMVLHLDPVPIPRIINDLIIVIAVTEIIKTIAIIVVIEMLEIVGI